MRLLISFALFAVALATLQNCDEYCVRGCAESGLADQACKNKCSDCRWLESTTNPITALSKDHQGPSKVPGFKHPAPGGVSYMPPYRRFKRQLPSLRPVAIRCSGESDKECPGGQMCVQQSSSSQNEIGSSWCVGMTCNMTSRDESKKLRCPEGQQCIQTPGVLATDIGGMCADMKMECRSDADCDNIGSGRWRCSMKPAGDGPLCTGIGKCGLCMHSGV